MKIIYINDGDKEKIEEEAYPIFKSFKWGFRLLWNRTYTFDTVLGVHFNSNMFSVRLIDSFDFIKYKARYDGSPYTFFQFMFVRVTYGETGNWI